MYEIVMINEKGEKFSKRFDSEYLYKNFLNKARRSKKVIICYYGRC